MPSLIGRCECPRCLALRPCLLLIAATALVIFATSAVAFGQPRSVANVLTIHTGDVDYPINPVLDAGIRDALRGDKAPPISYFAEYLELDRLSETRTARALSDYIERKYAGRRIDVVIAMRDPSLQFVLAQRARLFPKATVVFGGYGLVADERRAAERMTGVRLVNTYSATMKAALQLHPGVRRVYVVAISPEVERGAILRAELQRVSLEAQVTYLQAETFEQLISAVRVLPRGSLVLFAWYHSADRVTDQALAARQLADIASVPVYASRESLVGTGVVGGIVADVRGTGVRVGEMVRQVLTGTPTGDIPIVDAPAVPIFDWRQMRRWGLRPQDLPQGADIRFQGSTTWQQYRWLILAVAVMGAQMVLIAGLLRQRGRRRLAEKALVSREATLRAAYHRTRQLAGGLIHAQEAARIALSRDLHDDICQDIVGIAMSIDAVVQSSGRIQDPKNQYALSKLQRGTLNVAGRVRQVSHELHPASLQLVGLVSALKAHCLEVEARYQARITLHTTGDLSSIGANTALCLFRVAQEGMRNAIVHGASRNLELSLSRLGDDVELAVGDDGCGFDLESIRRDSSGLGLVIIEERVRAAGGEALIFSKPGEGTTVLACVPAGVPSRTETDMADAPLAVPDNEEHAAAPGVTEAQWTGHGC